MTSKQQNWTFWSIWRLFSLEKDLYLNLMARFEIYMKNWFPSMLLLNMEALLRKLRVKTKNEVHCGCIDKISVRWKLRYTRSIPLPPQVSYILVLHSNNNSYSCYWAVPSKSQRIHSFSFFFFPSRMMKSPTHPFFVELQKITFLCIIAVCANEKARLQSAVSAFSFFFLYF